jgi:hypothetical protein
MGGGLRCWLEREKKMGERRGGRFQREGEAVKRGRKWWYQPGQKNEGHRGAVCREETILWWAAAAGCERDRFRVSLPFFYLSKLPLLSEIQCSMVFIGKVLLGFQTSPSTFPFLLFSFFL